MADVEDLFADDSDGQQYSEDDSQSHGTRRRRQYSDEEELDEPQDNEEDDEEDEDDDYQKKGAKKDQRRKRPRTHNFLDIEASVDTDEEEDDDEEGALGDFIVDNEDELATAERDALRHRSTARPAMFQDETLDAEAIEAQLRERYSGYAAGKRGAAPAVDTDWVPQRLLLPGVRDPQMWNVRCSPGKERDIVMAAARRVLQWTSSGKFSNVFSIYSRDGLSGYIYVEARSQVDAQAALEGIPGVFASKMTLVPVDDMVDVVKVKTQVRRLNAGAWVRMRRGIYAGDLAQVVATIESSDAVEVRLVPRIDYSAEGRGRRGTRPAPRLFSIEEARRADPRTLSSRQNEILWKSERYIGGYLHKDVRIASLQVDDVKPTLEEIAAFAAGEADGDEQAAIAALASQAAAAAGGVDEANGLTGRDLQPGENIEVIEGDLAGVVGVVRSIESNNVVKVEPEMGALRRGTRTGTMSFPARQLRKRFGTGDHVKVLSGRHSGETGMVLAVADAVATVFTDIGGSEIRVLTRDLRLSSDIGAGAADQPAMVGLDVDDLVYLEGGQMGVVLKAGRDALTVLDDRSEIRTLAPRAARPARGGFERTGVDHGGNPIRRGDTVREVGGARRQGTVVQVTRFVVFVKMRDGPGGGTVFAVRTRQVESAAARQGSLDPYATRNMRTGGFDSGRGRGGRGGARGGRVGSLRGGRDPLVGKTVIANRGPYKGYAGIVKDITGTLARIELHTNARVVNVDKDKLSVRLPSGETVPAGDYMASNGGGGGGGGGGPRSRSPARSNESSAASGWNGSSGSDAGWGAPPAATPRSGGYDAGRAAAPVSSTPASQGAWDVATPSSTGGWDTGSGGGSVSGSWGTPAPFTPGALPQTPGGPFPQTPGSSGGYYDAPTPGGRPAEGSDGFFGWAVQRAVVVLASSGQRGVIKEVAPERQQAIVQLDSGSTQVIDRTSVSRIDPRPVRAEKRDRVVVIRGARKGALGTMVGKDGADALFQPDGDSAWHSEPLRNLAIYDDGSSRKQ
ncbi:transcription elongation factor spt5 [Coemansia sp. RSA 989]|nr:transcription elongation factor spt5 [Coemansia sp. RSA 1086]KAJ1867710.1 transcription elongation factor spt5 [Coemansia sp. RSA 989]